MRAPIATTAAANWCPATNCAAPVNCDGRAVLLPDAIVGATAGTEEGPSPATVAASVAIPSVGLGIVDVTVPDSMLAARTVALGTGLTELLHVGAIPPGTVAGILMPTVPHIDCAKTRAAVGC